MRAAGLVGSPQARTALDIQRESPRIRDRYGRHLIGQSVLMARRLVVPLGEMGRTPKPNATWGRDHWSQAFPAVLAGAGIRGGTVHGATNRHAAEVVDGPTSPEDLAATIYHALGIDPDLQLPDAAGRPLPIVGGGRPLRQLFG